MLLKQDLILYNIFVRPTVEKRRGKGAIGYRHKRVTLTGQERKGWVWEVKTKRRESPGARHQDKTPYLEHGCRCA
jgi:hypothetical protein